MRKSTLKIKDIRIKKEIYPRNRVNQSLIDEYVRDMKKGDIFPYIYVALFKGNYYLIDGRHRLEANKFLGEEFITAEIKNNFTNFGDMLLASYRANAKRGLKLNERDKLKVAYTLKDLKYEAVDISNLTGISANKIEKFSINQISKNIFEQKLKDKKLPEKLKFIEPKGKETGEGIVDTEKQRKLTKDELQIDELKEIYNYFKNHKFNIKNKEIFKLIINIKKVLRRIK